MPKPASVAHRPFILQMHWVGTGSCTRADSSCAVSYRACQQGDKSCGVKNSLRAHGKKQHLMAETAAGSGAGDECARTGPVKLTQRWIFWLRIVAEQGEMVEVRGESSNRNPRAGLASGGAQAKMVDAAGIEPATPAV